MPPCFITFEGPEGAGKSTQIQLLAEHLRRGQREVVVTREPGGTAIGERIRDVLLASESHGMTAETEALLMTAARAQHVADVIRPALEVGRIVLCDRFTDSTLAYQGGGRGLSIDALLRLQSFATGGLEPNLRILLDVPVNVGLARRMHDADSMNRLDEENVSFHQRVRSTYLELAEHPGWVVIDAARAPEIVAVEVNAAVAQVLAHVAATEPAASRLGR